MFTVSPDEMRRADALSDAEGVREIKLMKNAAKGCADVIIPLISRKDNVIILCGKGNNGGDGYELCAILGRMGYNVCAVNVLDVTPSGSASGRVFTDCVKNGSVILSSDKACEVLSKATLIVDAIFGTGFSGNIEKTDKIGTIIEKANGVEAKKIAIDVPSGINAEDGSVSDINFKADITVTMAYAKTGLLSYPAREFCGEIKVVDIGYPKEVVKVIKKDADIPDMDYIKDKFPKRNKNSHKGDFGKLIMYCGSPYMTGAAILAASAALRSGVGLVNIARDEKTLSVLQNHLIEPIFSPLSSDAKARKEEMLSLCEKATALLIGCGMGKDDGDREVTEHLLQNAPVPIILDADGINVISSNTHILRKAKTTPIITPHPLEFARLIGKDVSFVQQNRLSLAKEFAEESKCVVVLKGASTIIASPDGNVAINTTGSSGLSKGGSGDVLAGLIASFRAQGLSAYDSAVCGVYLHGLSCDVLCKTKSERGILPSDLPGVISELLP